MHEHFVYNITEMHGKCKNLCETDGQKANDEEIQNTLEKPILFSLFCIVTLFTLIFMFQPTWQRILVDLLTLKQICDEIKPVWT